MIVAGSVGMGLVWGWLLVMLVNWPPLRRPFRNLAAIIIYTGWLASIIYVYTGLTILIIFLIAALFAFLIHFSWRVRYRQG